jgi:hypothetical protein
VVTEQGADQVLVGPDQTDEELAHNCFRMRAQWLARDAISCGFSAATASRRHMTTKSSPARLCRWARKLSRTKRLSRLRSTARRAHFFAMASPRRTCRSAFGRARTVK